ncbi:DUF637 domain-containing protein [Moraxella sp. VT-16-12]|uniref:DUF637 domain-containing protein n=1 Tax=Moraxella sp. VT-16-12 TaxID=2014877 RepID=UPI000B7D9707|nr:hypothetical protein CEW93_006420 [Moraxella sp. VT-16-12]
MVNNKGDINKTLKDLSKSQAAKNMAKVVLTAGVTANLDKFLGQTPFMSYIPLTPCGNSA